MYNCFCYSTLIYPPVAGLDIFIFAVSGNVTVAAIVATVAVFTLHPPPLADRSILRKFGPQYSKVGFLTLRVPSERSWSADVDDEEAEAAAAADRDSLLNSVVNSGSRHFRMRPTDEKMLAMS